MQRWHTGADLNNGLANGTKQSNASSKHTWVIGISTRILQQTTELIRVVSSDSVFYRDRAGHGRFFSQQRGAEAEC